ncbi:hypothetical protein [Scytonema sp. PRP1]|uniref:hypothetical protein n=1 Tax=Scytonema sp. PRP1 TaxID=3120513 RepID=UPI00300D3CA3
MSADPEEEDVLMSEFDSVLDTPPLRPAIEEMVAMDLDADLVEIQKPMALAPLTPKAIEELFTTSVILRACRATFENKGEHIWQLAYKGQNYTVTFSPDVFDKMPSLRLMTFGDPLFEALLQAVGC